jgi:glycosyltransferase involved in cell wall biosynthesis
VVFLYVGRLRVRKGVEVLLEAFAELAKSAPEAELEIVGDGERRRQLERAVRRLGLDRQVRFLGRLDARAIRERMLACRGLVVPSTYEGMPLVVLEAMDASRAVVASAVSGIPEVVVDGETGWLVPPEDVAALVGALLAAARDPEEAARRGHNGRLRLDARFRPDHAAEAWLAAVGARLEAVSSPTIAGAVGAWP